MARGGRRFPADVIASAFRQSERGWNGGRWRGDAGSARPPTGSPAQTVVRVHVVRRDQSQPQLRAADAARQERVLLGDVPGRIPQDVRQGGLLAMRQPRARPATPAAQGVLLAVLLRAVQRGKGEHRRPEVARSAATAAESAAPGPEPTATAATSATSAGPRRHGRTL